MTRTTDGSMTDSGTTPEKRLSIDISRVELYPQEGGISPSQDKGTYRAARNAPLGHMGEFKIKFFPSVNKGFFMAVRDASTGHMGEYKIMPFGSGAKQMAALQLSEENWTYLEVQAQAHAVVNGTAKGSFVSMKGMTSDELYASLFG